MINLNFLPSRRLALYMARLFLTRSAAVMVALVMVLMALDLLGESPKILAVPGNGEAELWHYVALRVPLLIQRFMPFSVLLGTLISFTALNQHSEVVAMKAAGLSAHQILAPLIVASIGVAGLAFAFNETIAVNSARQIDAWSDADYKKVPPETGIETNVWIIDGEDLVRAGYVGANRGRIHLERVTIYDRQGITLRRTIEADRAIQAGTGWRLSTVRIYDADANVVRRQPTLDALAGVTPDRFRLAKVDPAELSLPALGLAIAELRAAGRPTDEALTGWWHKLSGPLSTLLMPLLAAVAAFGLARAGQVLLRASVGMALGFAYFVADNFSIALGNSGAYPPLLAAWAPFMLFLLIGEFILIRGEE